jgi:hypothetical protein
MVQAPFCCALPIEIRGEKKIQFSRKATLRTARSFRHGIDQTVLSRRPTDDQTRVRELGQS